MDPLPEALRPIPGRSRWAAWGTALRPEQWLKNTVVAAGTVFGLRLADPSAWLAMLAAFCVFSAASSGVYLVNDVVDRERDRGHPSKRRRPIAAGEISPGAALWAGGLLSAIAFGGALRLAPGVAAAVGAYLLLNVLYSLVLKHVPIVDVIAIALGFVLRAAAGAAAVSVVISPWLVICTFTLMLFLAIAKRRAELAAAAPASPTRRSSRGYSLELLDQMITVLVATTLVSYCLYTLSPDVRAKLGADHLYLTVPFVVYGIFRYLVLVRETRGTENPARAVLGDRPLLLTLALWSATVVALLYSGAGAGSRAAGG
ncbi:MAG: decaprenyl-phosphate phosphoribosyltransferase [Myxococcota bacterium]